MSHASCLSPLPTQPAPQAAGAAAAVAAEHAQVRVKESGKVPDEGPPTESLGMVVETVLSRQGRVDIIVSCPMGEFIDSVTSST